MHIALLGVEFEVVEPEELGGALAELAGRFARAAERRGSVEGRRGRGTGTQKVAKQRG